LFGWVIVAVTLPYLLLFRSLEGTQIVYRNLSFTDAKLLRGAMNDNERKAFLADMLSFFDSTKMLIGSAKNDPKVNSLGAIYRLVVSSFYCDLNIALALKVCVVFLRIKESGFKILYSV
jgi:hypothetical protein